MTELLEPWPPYCCVPAFVDAALRELGANRPSRLDLARSLAVTVPDGVANPWHLPTAASETLAGVTPKAALVVINGLLRDVAPELRMRYVPFRSIALQLYADLADQALRRKVVGGIGLDWSDLQRDGGGVHRHLLRLLDTRGTGARLLDDSLGLNAEPVDVPWDRLERSVHAVDDGLWLIGHAADLVFDAAGPWSASETR